MVKPQARRAAVRHVQEAHGLSERRACGLIGIGRSSLRYEPREKDDEALRDRLTELARKWRRAGYRGLHRHLRREGWEINHKRLYRVYREMGLQVRRRKRKRLKRPARGEVALPTKRNEVWAMDFVHDSLVDGRRIRAFTIVDLCTRECPAIEVATSIPGDRVVRVLDRLCGSPWASAEDRVRQRAGVPELLDGRVGPGTRCRARLHRARQARPELLR